MKAFLVLAFIAFVVWAIWRVNMEMRMIDFRHDEEAWRFWKRREKRREKKYRRKKQIQIAEKLDEERRAAIRCGITVEELRRARAGKKGYWNLDKTPYELEIERENYGL